MKNTPSINRVNDCEVCSQRLEKVLTDLDAAEISIKSLQSEIESRRRLDATNSEIIAKKDEVIKSQDALIKILEKKSKRKVSILFGLVKITY